jgi:large subunit ribosomal protein L21
MFAVIKSGGRQYKVSVGQKLEVERLPLESGSQVAIEEVLLVSDADNTRIGSPFIDDTQVLATIDEHTRGEKLIVFKYKAKKRYRHRRGHRQELTVLLIDDIVTDGKSLVTGEAPKAKEAPVVETEEAPATTVEPVAEESSEETDTSRRVRRRSSETEPESSTEE